MEFRELHFSYSDGGFMLRKLAVVGALTVATTLVLTSCSGALSIEDAGQRYLSAVCPANAAVDPMNAAIDGDDLDAIHATTKAYGEAARSAAKTFSDPSIKWPEAVDPKDLKAVADSYLSDLAVINEYTAAQSPEETRKVSWPGDDAGASAAQGIRLALDLPSDTTESCAGFEAQG